MRLSFAWVVAALGGYLAIGGTAQVCPPGQCFTAEGCVPSVSGTLCVECFARGYLVGDVCVCYANQQPLDLSCDYLYKTSVSVPSDCWPGMCEVDDGVCVTSTPTVRCVECLYQGYLVDRLVGGVDLVRTCECFDGRRYDAGIRCAPVFDAAPTATLSANQSLAWVNASQSLQIGCYEQNDAPHDFGTPNPPLPYRCCSPAVGPPPNTGLTECDTFVGLDPDVEPCVTAQGENCGDPTTCAGHGRWDGSHCVCDHGWKLVGTGLFFENQETYVCSECEGWNGPRVYPDMCTGPYTPDPLTGEDAVCGGNGILVDGACVCYQSDADGWWALVDVTAVFRKFVYVSGLLTEVQYSSTVATCGICSAGASPPPGEQDSCSVNVFAPTSSPTASPTSLQKSTLFLQSVGNATFDWRPTDCGVGVRVVESDGVSIADLPQAWGFSGANPVYSGDFLIAESWSRFSEGVLNNSLRALTNATGWWTLPCPLNATESIARLTNATEARGDYLASCSDELARLCVVF